MIKCGAFYRTIDLVSLINQWHGGEMCMWEGKQFKFKRENSDFSKSTIKRNFWISGEYRLSTI